METGNNESETLTFEKGPVEHHRVNFLTQDTGILFLPPRDFRFISSSLDFFVSSDIAFMLI